MGTAPPILKDKKRKNKAEKHNLKASAEGISAQRIKTAVFFFMYFQFE